MIKVLQIIDGTSYSGICKLLNDVEKNISKNIKFDYLTSIDFDERFNNLNVDRSTLNGKIIYNHRLYKFLKKNKYDIVHINSGAFFFTFCCAIVCKIAKIKKIIVHSHNSPNISIIKRIFMNILNPLYRKITNVHLTCSDSASKSLFTKTEDVILIKNGIDINKYKFNESIRKKIRREWNITNKEVYGHIGVFNKQKNHVFLIDLFYEIQKRKPNSTLLLIGDGDLKKEIELKVNNLNIADKVLFLGFRNDINNILNAMDILLLPSLYEGLSIVAIEAQTNGLPTVVSNGVPEEANISKNYIKMNDFDKNKWIDKIFDVKKEDRNNSYKHTIKSGYDIKITTKQLEKIYFS